MADEKQPDYTTMSGAEFQRAVGADPAKWAAAFVQRDVPFDGHRWTSVDRAKWVEGWFRDAMDAARRDAKVRLDGD